MKICTTFAGALLLALGTGGVQAGDASRHLFKWTDEHGVTHFGDEIPQTAVKQEHAVLKHDGQVAKLEARELTPEEVAARDQKEREARAQEAHDRSLLLTYSSENDLVQARTDHLKTLDARIANAQKAADETQSKQTALRERQAKLAPDDKAAQDETVKQLGALDKTLADNKAALAHLQDDRQKTDTQFAADIDRYHVLKQSAPTPTS